MPRQLIHVIAVAMLGVATIGSAAAGLSADQVARLGNDLTPLGGEKAGNADGTIPAWTGGVTAPPAGYTPGRQHPDPFADDEVLFTVTAANMEQFKALLTPGHQALLKTYPTYKMKIYPTRRSAAVPQRIYDATRKVAATATLIENGHGVTGATVGIPFPIPTTALEVMWNHLLRYRGDIASRTIAQAAPTRGGSYTLVRFEDEFNVIYSKAGVTEAELDNKILLFKQEVTAPARLAGGILLVHETLNQVKENRSAWLYNPGQRRVRRAPNVAYDNPGTASDGMRTSDQFDMFNGAVDRYDWKLVGKQEMYVPYNSYALHSDSLTYKQILTPLHINQEYPRYEAHRVWVVEATLKSSARHIYKKRVFFIDEDSWQIVHVDQYDNRDQLWRVSEGHGINYYDVPCYWTTLEVHTDLQAGRYLAIGLDNEERAYNFGAERTMEDYTPAALRRAGTR